MPVPFSFARHAAPQTGDPETAVALALSLAEQPPPPHAPEKFKMVLVVRGDLGMSAGKVAAQCVHAALAAYRQALAQAPLLVRAWEGQGETTICVQCSGDEELQVVGCGAAVWDAWLMSAFRRSLWQRSNKT